MPTAHKKDVKDATSVDDIVWWHVDKNGRKIGWMWPEDFESLLLASYLRADGLEVFMYDFGISKEDMDAWLSGEQPIPKWVARIVTTLKDRVIFAARLETVAHAKWLPNTTEHSNSKNREKPYIDEQAKQFRDRSPTPAGPLEPKHHSKDNENKDPINLTNYFDARLQDNRKYLK